MKRQFPAGLSALLLFGCIIGCAAQPGLEQTTETVKFSPPKSIKAGPQLPLEPGLPGVTNFGMISKDVWRGAQPSELGLKTLADIGVKTIIDLRIDDELAFVPKGVRYIHMPLSSWTCDRLDVAKMVKTLKDCPKPVFVHCREGRDRTGLAIAAYRLSQGMTAADTCQELRNFHVNFWWQSAIEKRIYDLEKNGLPQ